MTFGGSRGTLDEVLQLSDADLKELGIKMGDRKKILACEEYNTLVEELPIGNLTLNENGAFCHVTTNESLLVFSISLIRQ